MAGGVGAHGGEARALRTRKWRHTERSEAQGQLLCRSSRARPGRSVDMKEKGSLMLLMTLWLLL